MEELTKNLSSISWWFGVVAVGLVVNVASAYLKAPLDKFLSTISNSWNSRSQRAREVRAERVRQARESDRQLQLLIAEELRDRLRAVNHMLVAIFVLLTYVMARVRVPSEVLNSDPVLSGMLKVIYWFSMLLFFISIHTFRRAMSSRDIISDATRA